MKTIAQRELRNQVSRVLREVEAGERRRVRHAETEQHRVYEAVGTVTDVPAPGAPVISWRNYEIYHGPCGAQASPCVTNYDRLFPITAVDGAGKVYAFWSDGYHILSKTDATGTGWNPTTTSSSSQVA